MIHAVSTIEPLKRNRFEVFYTLDDKKSSEDTLRLNTHKAFINNNEVVLFLYLDEDDKVSDAVDKFPTPEMTITIISYKGDHSISEKLTYTLTDITIDKDYNFDWHICDVGCNRNIIVTGKIV
jgi:hypothetical protein